MKPFLPNKLRLLAIRILVSSLHCSLRQTNCLDLLKIELHVYVTLQISRRFSVYHYVDYSSIIDSLQNSISRGVKMIGCR